MNTLARLALLLLGPGLAACVPPVAAPTQRASTPPPRAAAAVRAPIALPIGEPVLVSQRLPESTLLADLDSSGRLALVRGDDGLHVVDLETGRTRGVRGGCADQAGFAPEGHAVVIRCKAGKTLRLWDLATDTTREIALSRSPLQLDLARSGGRAAVMGPDGVDVIDLASGARTAMETGAQRDVTLTAFAASGRIATSDEAAVVVFEASGKLVSRTPSVDPPQRIALSPSGHLLAVADASGLAIIDVDRGAQRSKLTPCAGAWQRDLAWTDDERHLVVSCGDRLPQRPARVLMLSPEGAEQLVLIEGANDGASFSITPLGGRLGVSNSSVGGVVFEASTGKELFRIPPPAGDARPPRFSGDGERVLFHDGGRVEQLALIDRAGHRLNAPIRPSARPLILAPTAGLLALGSVPVVAYLDPATGVARFDPPGELSPDGATFLVRGTGTSSSFDLVDRATGARHHVDTDSQVPDSPVFSSRGDWVGYPVAKSTDGGRSYEHLDRLYDARTGAPGKSFSFGFEPTHHQLSFSDDDQLVATVSDNGRCDVDPRCTVAQVFDARSGRRLATIDQRKESSAAVQFLPGGKLLVVDSHVHDARSGRVAWTIPRGAFIAATIGRKAQLLLTTVDRAFVVEAATCKTVRELEPLGTVLAQSDDGAFVLTQHRDEIALWDSATWTKKPATPPLPSHPTTIVLARDGRLAWFVDGDDLVAYRFADGRALRRAMPGFDVDVTDEGVFDPTQIGNGALLARLGPDVEHSPMGPSERAAGKLGHPRLFADFVAGKPVSPRP